MILLISRRGLYHLALNEESSYLFVTDCDRLAECSAQGSQLKRYCPPSVHDKKKQYVRLDNCNMYFQGIGSSVIDIVDVIFHTGRGCMVKCSAAEY